MAIVWAFCLRVGCCVRSLASRLVLWGTGGRLCVGSHFTERAWGRLGACCFLGEGELIVPPGASSFTSALSNLLGGRRSSRRHLVAWIRRAVLVPALHLCFSPYLFPLPIWVAAFFGCGLAWCLFLGGVVPHRRRIRRLVLACVCIGARGCCIRRLVSSVPRGQIGAASGARL